MCLVACLGTAMCGDGPTSPDPAPVPGAVLLPGGGYLLSVGSAPDTPCSGDLAAWGLFGPSIGTRITLTPDGQGWVGREESQASGNLEIRFAVTSPQTAGAREVAVAGTIRGTAIHILALPAAPPRTAVMTGPTSDVPATLEGHYIPEARSLLAWIQGTTTFTHPTGGNVTCPRAAIILGR